jgi:hypothetical protein
VSAHLWSPGEAASDAFAGLIGPRHGTASEPRPGELIGLEHEFVVRSPDRVVDFRELIGDLPLDGRRLDPGDRNAYRCGWGGVVTADGFEAEVAIAPVRRAPGFVARLERDAIVAREALRRALPSGLRLDGYSTHLSLSMPAAMNAAACRLFLSTFAPGMMLLADRIDSPGLLVRPRPGRMELATEYVGGAQLRAVTAFAAGAAAATADALRIGRPAQLPPTIRARAVPTSDRFGWGLARDAFGEDLLRGGREAVLTRERGGTIRAQEHLERAWAAARAALGRGAAPADLEAADRAVGGLAPLPFELGADALAGTAGDGARSGPVGRIVRSPFGDILQARRRPAFTVSAEIATWDTTVFAIAGPWRRAYASVPRASLRRFLGSLDRGDLDRVLQEYLDAPAEGRLLATWSQAVQPGLYDAVAPTARLLATEVAAPAGSALAIATGTDRLGKGEVPRTGKTGTGGGIPWLPIALIVLLIIGLLVGGSALGLLGGGTPVASPSGPGAATSPSTPVSPSSGVVGASPSPGATCTGPANLIVDQFYPDLAETGGATSPAFRTPSGKRFCLTHLATYHWNEGAGAPAGGTFTLLDGTGTVVGTWKAVATPATNDVLANWEADIPTSPPVVLDGSYTLVDSDPATLSLSKLSGGAGFVRVWGQEYVEPGGGTSEGSPSASPSPAEAAGKVIITGMIDSDSPTLDQCGTGQNDHNVYSFLVLVALPGQPDPPPSAYAPLLGRTATLTLTGPPDAGTYTSTVLEFAGHVQIRFDGHLCPDTTARSTFGSLAVDGLTLQPGAGTGFIADLPVP